MCGIAGIVAREAPQPGQLEAELQRLASYLSHRGPDDHGVAACGPVGLAHTRLSILDLSPTGSQPMWSHDRRHLLVYNGEVYNFQSLREELEADGERFAGHGDTEVVLRLLMREGEAALPRLDGMFALAFLDVASGEVLLARDRAGQKPLYLAEGRDGAWLFSSEIRPLLASSRVDAALSPEGLCLLLGFGFVPAPYTLRRRVRQLLPGCFARLRPGASPRIGRFFDPPGPIQPQREGDLESLSVELEELLSASVRDHLISDVPVGVLLSGGVDSSTVAALAARHAGELKTFAIVHRDPAYDEREAARAVARAIGSDHHEIELSDEPLSEAELDRLIDHHGDPFADSSSLAVLRLAEEIRRHVTVALSGDGADEVFAGYPRFAELRVMSALARVPDQLLALGRGLCRAVPGAAGRRMARALLVASMPPHRRPVSLFSLFWPAEQVDVLRPEWLPEDGAALFDGLLSERGAGLVRDPVDAAHWLEQRLVLPDDMLTKVDRMSMAASLEVRPPILGGAVLDFAAALPFSAKHRGRTGKRVLRELARRLVPPWVVDRPKQGFAVPLAAHGGRVFEDAAGFALDSEESPLRKLFRPCALATLSRTMRETGEGRDPEDSPYRRVHRRWLLALLARTLARHGGV